MLVSVPSPRARESARGEAFLHIVWQSRLIRPSELFLLYAHEVTFGDTANLSPSGCGGTGADRIRLEANQNLC